MEQKEIFIINDVTLDINPSDIKLIEDNYVTQESFLRTKSVAAYRSRYAASKIVVTIPVEIDDIIFTNELKYEELPGILKVIIQLDTYPFCFIKSSRIQTYVSPTSVSSTGFLMFAVDELNIHCKSELSNIMFLELSLVYFNHAPLVKDFKFKKTVNLETYTDAAEFKYEVDPQPFGQGVNSLAESLSWKRYFETIINDLKYNIDKNNFKLIDPNPQASDGLFNSLRVHIGVPIIHVMSSAEDSDSANILTDIAFTGRNSKIVRSSKSKPEVLDTILTDKEKGQEFTSDANNPEHPDYDPTPKPTQEEISLNQALDKAVLTTISEKQEFFNQSKLHIIDYVEVPLIEYNTIVQSIVYRKKNKLAINHIGSLKHPVIQYLGKYPTEVILQFTADVRNEYKDIGTVGASAILKEKLNIVDYNKTMYPEVIAYNNIKIFSLPTFLTNNLTYLPNQFHINATSEQQGIETFTCTFVENDLKEFLQIGDVVNSGKNSSGLIADFSHKVLLKFSEDVSKFLSNPKISESEKEKYREINVLIFKLSLYILQEFGGPKPDLTTPFYAAVLKANPTLLPLLPLATKLEKSYVENEKIFGAEIFQKISPYTLIQARRNVVTGLLSQMPEHFKGHTFSELYESNYLIKQIIGEIIKGAENGLEVCIQTVNAFEEDLFDKIYHTSYAFNGQTINDLQLERASKDHLGYIEETDSLVQNINPFFFIEETKILDTNILRTVYEQVTSVDNAVEQALGVEAEERRKDLGDASDFDSSMTEIMNTYPPVTDFSSAITEENKGEYTRNTFRIMDQKPAKYSFDANPSTIEPLSADYSLVINSTMPGTNKKYSDIVVDNNKEAILKYKKYITDAGLVVSDEEWLVFSNTLGLLESDYKFDAVLKGTYFGKYQISLIALKDLKLIDSNSQWINPPGYTFDKFKKDTDFQEKVFAMYCALNYKYIISELQKTKSVDLLDKKTPAEKLGILAAAHFGFTAGIAVLKGEDRRDGNGISAKSRYTTVVTALQGLIIKPETTLPANTTKSSGGTTPSNGPRQPGGTTHPVGVTSAGVAGYQKALNDAENKPTATSAQKPAATAETKPQEKPTEQTSPKAPAASPAEKMETRKLSDAQLSIYSNAKEKSSSDSIGTVLKKEQAPFNSNKTFSVSSGFGRRKGGLHRGIDIVIQGGSIDGEPITPAADGVVIAAFFDSKGGGGNTVIVQHNNLYKTGYCHLSKITCKVNDNVTAFKTVIGNVGGRKGAPGAGRSTGPHLHYSIKYDDTFIDPLLILDLKASVGNTEGNDINSTTVGFGSSPQKVATSWGNNTVLDESYPVTVYDEAVWLDRFIKMSNRNINKGLACGFPTIKVYVTVGNEDNDFLVGETGKIIEFYELRGIRDFHLNTNNQFNPVDVVTMVVANPNFIRTDEMTLLSSRPTIDYNSIATDYATQFKNNMMKLLPGMKLHIRMGYSNNPNNLDIVFNGSVIDTTAITGSSIRVVAEGFGKELLADVLGTTAPQKLGGGWNGSTGTIFADLMVLPSIYHFGKTYTFLRMLATGSGGDDTDPEAKTLLSGDTSVLSNRYKDYSSSDSPYLNLNYYLGFKVLSNVTQRSRIYTNIYSADIEKVDDEFSSPFLNLFANTFFNTFSRAITYDYFAVKETPWEVMRQMTYRHPGTYVKPLMYEDRCTLFFGIREQMYIARDSDKFLMESATTAKLNDDSENVLIDKYVEDRVRRLEPVFNFHIINSEMNLISNQIKLNGNFKTKVNVGYREDNSDINSVQDWETFSMGLDDNLAPWEIRTTDLVLSGCDHRYMAYRYGTVKLQEEAETMYEGKIFIVGNSAVKSGDYAYIHDTTRRLFGIIKIRECIHHFDEKNGFVTEITPGLFVEPAEFVRSTLFIRLGLVSRIVSEGLITNEIIANAFSTETLEAVTKCLTIQNQFSKLARPDRDNNLGAFDNLIETARDDPGLIAWYSVPAGLLGLTSWVATKKLLTATRFSYLLAAPMLGKSPLAAINKAFVDTVGYFSNKGKSARAMYSLVANNRENIKDFARLTKSILEFGRVSSGTPLARYYLGASKLLAKPAAVGSLKLIGQGLLRFGVVMLRTTTLLLGILNPMALVITVITQLMLNYVTAKLEEEHYTRQPLLLYPLVANSKPYVAGITGAKRNSFWDSLQTEGIKTLHSIRKAATIIANKRAMSGKDDSLFLNMLSYNISRNRASFSVDKDGKVVTNIYANGALLKRGTQGE